MFFMPLNTENIIYLCVKLKYKDSNITFIKNLRNKNYNFQLYINLVFTI